MSNTRNLSKFAADVPTSIGTAGQFLKVNTGASAFEWGVVGDTLPSGATPSQYLTRNAANNDYEWIDRPSIYLPNAVMPSDFSSPTNTYSTSGTWSKGSTAGSTGVWMYLLGGGSGGGNRNHTGNGGRGGYAALVYLTADEWDGATYTIGTGGAGGANGSQGGSSGTATTITLSSANGSTVYSSDNQNIVYGVPASFQAPTTTSAGITITAPAWSNYNFSYSFSAAGQNGTPTDYFFSASGGDHGDVRGHHGVFSGGGGSGHSNGLDGIPLGAAGTSIYGGNGSYNANGVYPGGGASAKYGGGTGYTGAAGNLRAYHV